MNAIGTVLGIVGLIALAFTGSLAISRGILRGCIRRMTAHLQGLEAYHEARNRSLEYERLEGRVFER